MTEKDPVQASSQFFPIVCFSHLGWDNKLFQRPQQIMLRMARQGHPVYYFGCAGRKAAHEASARGQIIPGLPLYIYPLTFSPFITRYYGPRRWLACLQVASIFIRHGIQKPVLWFYHPSLFPLGYSHRDSAIVYDVMDHFPSFENSHDDVYFDELALLAECDVVFSGGGSLQNHVREMLAQLQDTKNSQSKSVVMKCLPSGIDYDHFNNETEPNSDLIKFPTPRFGYTGAVDERIDWSLLIELAKTTEGSVILVGPVLSPPPSDIPDNLHLTGALDYALMPSILAAMNVCIIPFKSSSLVQYVSPTKTPEYLAMEKPVVSTFIPDVVTDYGNLVKSSRTPEQFIAACLEAATAPQESYRQIEDIKLHLSSWDHIAGTMLTTVRKAIGITGTRTP